MCHWVLFSAGGVWGGRSCMPWLVWRSHDGVHAVMIAQCAVRCGTSCGRAGLVCLYSTCECAMWCAWLAVGLVARVCVRACVLVV